MSNLQSCLTAVDDLAQQIAWARSHVLTLLRAEQAGEATMTQLGSAKLLCQIDRLGRKAERVVDLLDQAEGAVPEPLAHHADAAGGSNGR
jgi:hypothetical protein